jgi:cytochrome c oxidase cbb3-type subunit 3
VATKIEKDAVTGRETTGHEWDGRKELNTPLPKWWLYVFFACIAWAAGMCVLYPSFPYGPGYWHGLLGYSQRRAVDAEVAALSAQRKVSMDAIATLDFAAVRANPQLQEVALTGGQAAFATNCQPCHRAGGRRMDLGRFPGRDPADRHARHPQRGPGCKAGRDAAVRRRRHVEAR